jgi:5-methylthioadenosine/S-adenosylhomocysteine deaminase
MFLLTNATVITMDSERRIIDDGAVLVDGNAIRDVGPASEVRSRQSAAEVIDLGGDVLLPGLVNTHTHTFQSLLKGLGDDKVLYRWFTEMTGPAAAQLTPNDAQVAARHTALEAIRSGTTTVADFSYAHPTGEISDAVIEAFDQAGVRLTFGRGYLTRGTDEGVPPELLESTDAALQDCERLIRSYHRPDGRITVALAPCMIWAVDEDTLEKSRAVADQYGVGLHMHVSETDYEINWSQKRYGLTDLEYLAQSGFLGPDVVCVHCTLVDDRGIRILREFGAKVSHNPTSNMYLGSGIPPIPAMQVAGIDVGLASDGPASNNNQNMIHVLKMAALIQKGHRKDATAMTAEGVLDMAVLGGAATLGATSQIGSVEPGKRADLVVMRFDNPFIGPVHNPVSALVYSALGTETRWVIVDGEVVMRDGELTTIDEDRALADSQRTADALRERALHTSGRRPWRSIGS